MFSYKFTYKSFWSSQLTIIIIFPDHMLWLIVEQMGSYTEWEDLDLGRTHCWTGTWFIGHCWGPLHDQTHHLQLAPEWLILGNTMLSRCHSALHGNQQSKTLHIPASGQHCMLNESHKKNRHSHQGWQNFFQYQAQPRDGLTSNLTAKWEMPIYRARVGYILHF